MEKSRHFFKKMAKFSALGKIITGQEGKHGNRLLGSTVTIPRSDDTDVAIVM